MKKSLIKLLRRHGLFLLILIFAAALRFYRLAEMTSFAFDQEYALNFAYSVLREFSIQLIGQGFSVQGLFMGPLYFYYLVPFFAIFNLHPIGGAVGSVFFGLGIIVAYWNFGFKYLFKLYGRVSQNDLVEGSIYTIVTPKSLTPESIDVDSGNVGLILPERQK